jgi:hypothetical protein
MMPWASGTAPLPHPREHLRNPIRRLGLIACLAAAGLLIPLAGVDAQLPVTGRSVAPAAATTPVDLATEFLSVVRSDALSYSFRGGDALVAATGGWGGAGRGAVWGGLIGASAGATACLIDSSCREDGSGAVFETALWFGAMGAMLGTAVGAIWGTDEPPPSALLDGIRIVSTGSSTWAIQLRVRP